MHRCLDDQMHLSDRQLLERFAAHGNDSAFTSLVHRHGPMVLAVCRRILRHAADAEDAFQAVFLILARKAASIGNPDLLANWLYGVAYRTALDARSKSFKRRGIEMGVVDEVRSDPASQLIWNELREVLDDEINRLPDKYRAPFVLCHVEGRTNEQAAAALGCPKGTVLSRLSTARERLRSRLTRRGVTLSSALLTALVSQKATAAVPASLASSTVHASVKVAAGHALSGVVSGKVAVLTEGVLKAMFLSKLKLVVASAVALFLLGIGTAMLAHTALQDAAPKADKDSIQGTWEVASATDGGREPPPKEVQGAKMVIADGTLALTFPDGKKLESTYQIDSGKRPKWIDVTDTKAGRKMLGIYRLKGDNLTIVLDESGERGRPDDFVSEQNSPNDLLIVLRRERK